MRKHPRSLPRIIPTLVGSLILLIAAAFIMRFVLPSQVAGEQTLGEASATYKIESNLDLANEDGRYYATPIGSSKTIWLGTGQDANNSFLGMRFSGPHIPKGTRITSATVSFVPNRTQWINVHVRFYGEAHPSPEAFSRSNLPSKRVLTQESVGYKDNVKWIAGQAYTYNVTAPVQAIINGADTTVISLIAKGEGGSWGRKFLHGQITTGKSPVLTISYSGASGSGDSHTPTPTTVRSLTATPTTTPQPTLSPTPVPATSTPTPVPSQPSSPPPTSSSGEIFGAVPADSLGTCSAEVHDRYVVRGPDGILYRTWHPIRDPSGCSFAHEHGAFDPSTSNADSGLPAFGYIGRQVGMDEPHVGFKVYGANAGTRNDEGSSALHDSRIVFHMGTGGAGRFSARFHSMEFDIVTNDGQYVHVNGLADTGNAGTICSNPRQGRTVMGLGCVVDSGYEIWENKLKINNRGQTVVSTIASTAVFDPITIMDGSDLTRTIYTWSPDANPIFRFKGARDAGSFRGCRQETYHGPVYWYNRGGGTVYYTDAYGNVVDNGPIKQEISAYSSNFGSATGGLGFIATYKSGNQSEPMTQFKLPANNCGPSLGIKN